MQQGSSIMKNDRQVYFSGNFTNDGLSYAQPVKALDKSREGSVIIILSAMMLFCVVVEMIITRI